MTYANTCVIIIGRNRGVFMNQDLRYIKKQYGEKMMHLCREIFSTILDTSPGLLPKILIETFYPTHYLYDDLVTNNAIQRFKNYIYTAMLLADLSPFVTNLYMNKKNQLQK